MKPVARYRGRVKNLAGYARVVAYTVAVSVVFVGVSLWLGRDHDTATAADWLAAFATLAAFAAAMFAGWYVARTYNLEQTREADRVNDVRRAQASLVSVWAESGLHTAYGEGGSSTFAAFIDVYLRNASELPVHMLVVQLRARQADPSKFWEYGDTEGVVELPAFRRDTLPPNDEPTVIQIVSPQLAELANAFESVPNQPSVVVAVSAAFRDSAGRTWARRTDGVLVEVDAPFGQR